MNLSSSSSSDNGSSSESEDEQTDLCVPKPPSLVKQKSENIGNKESVTLSSNDAVCVGNINDNNHTSYANASLEKDFECNNADIEDDEEDDDDIEWEDADSTEVDVSKENANIFSKSEISSVDNYNTDPSLLYRSMPSKEVCINFENSDSEQQKNDPIAEPQKQKKRPVVKKRKRNLNLKNVPSKLKKLALDVHRAHLLALTSRANQISKICSHEELMHIAFSLIPSKFHMYADKRNHSTNNSSIDSPLDRIVPNIDIVNEFIQWFCDFVNSVESRRRRNNNIKPASKKSNASSKSGNKRKRKRAKHPTHQFEGHGILQLKELSDLILYLSPSYDPGVSERERYVSPHEKAQLFIVFTRSIGWRTRYVTVLEPIGPHINLNHPLLAPSLKDFFLLFQKKALTSELGDGCLEWRQEREKARTKQTNSNKYSGKYNLKRKDNESNDNQRYKDALAWAEILVQYPPSQTEAKKEYRYDSSTRGTLGNHKWVHTDIARELVNEPFLVESILELVHKSESFKTTNIHRVKKLPLAYALAIEHPSNHESFFNEITSHTMIDIAEYTDVTAMYANSWSISQKLRGVSNKEIISNDNSFNIWWESTLSQLNRQIEQPTHRNLIREQAKGNVKKRQTKDLQKQSKMTSIPNGVVDLTEKDNDTERFSKEKNELSVSRKETIPTSKAAFKNHPVYVIPSILKKAEVLAPDAKSRICGTFKGELIYKRSDVSEAFTCRKWLYLGRKVKDSQIPNPVKKVTAKKKPIKTNFQRMDSYGINIDDQTNDPKLLNLSKSGESESEDCLYGVWQTNAWSPPRIMPEDPIPINEYKNVELELLNPGLRHMEEKQMSIVAKKLGVPYAPCLIGFEGHGGKRTPTIKGIVVHEHNVDLLLEAHTEWESQNLEKTHRDRHKEVCKRWKKIIFGLLTKERLEKEYSLNSS